MKPGRYNTNGIAKRLTERGFIHESDLVWLEKREYRLAVEIDNRDGIYVDGSTMDIEKNELTKIRETLAKCFVPCTGEAHSNAFIDNCMCCAPRWGKVVNHDKVLRKLSVDQLAALRRLSPDVVTTSWEEEKPFRSLITIGFAEERRIEAGRWIITVTDKGREHLRADELPSGRACDDFCLKTSTYCRICKRRNPRYRRKKEP